MPWRWCWDFSSPMSSPGRVHLSGNAAAVCVLHPLGLWPGVAGLHCLRPAPGFCPRRCKLWLDFHLAGLHRGLYASVPVRTRQRKTRRAVLGECAGFRRPLCDPLYQRHHRLPHFGTNRLDGTFSNPYLYSAVYNGSYILMDLALCLIVFGLSYKTVKKYYLAEDIC